jgi:hypothetical protein
MSLIDDNGDPARLIKYLNDAVPAGPHPEPHAEWVQVRLDVVQTAADHIEWLEKGNEEWRQMIVATERGYKAEAAARRIAVGHLQAVLNKARTHAEQQAADTAARDWLTSIGSEPS